jgi:hypothetical protein
MPVVAALAIPERDGSIALGELFLLTGESDGA